jgi:anti-sigma regulatory factor (Ser/Thr protein kinase)
VVLLPYEPASVSAARWRLVADLSEAGVGGPAAGDAALVMSELLSNAIRHARPLPGLTVQAAWTLTNGWLEIAVSDGGASTLPHAARLPLSAVGGRGLTIVEHLSMSWGIRTSDWGTTVWAVLAAPHGRPKVGVAAGHHRMN